MKDIAFEFICKDCGNHEGADNEKSNENWKVHSTKCSKCGGKVEMKLKEC